MKTLRRQLSSKPGVPCVRTRGFLLGRVQAVNRYRFPKTRWRGVRSVDRAKGLLCRSSRLRSPANWRSRSGGGKGLSTVKVSLLKRSSVEHSRKQGEAIRDAVSWVIIVQDFEVDPDRLTDRSLRKG